MLKYILCLAALLFSQAIFAQENIQAYSKKMSVKSALELAIMNNPKLKNAEYLIKAEEGKNLSENSPAPLEINFINEFIPHGKGLSNYQERVLEISQSFDFPSLYFSRASKASILNNANKADFKKEILALSKSVLRAYMNIASQKNVVEIARENFNIAEESLNKTEIKYKLGEISNLEFLTSKLQLSEARSQLDKANKEILEYYLDLHILLGDSDNQIEESELELSDSLVKDNITVDIKNLISASLASNPTILKAELMRNSYDMDKTIAWSGLLPSFNIGYGLQNNNQQEKFYSVNFGFSLPIWFMFDNKGKIQEADAMYIASDFELQNEKNELINRIKKDYNNFDNSKQQFLQYQKEILPSAEEIYNIAKKSYFAGEINYIEYLQAKLSYINSKNSYEKALLDYNMSIINLEESTGLSIIKQWNQ